MDDLELGLVYFFSTNISIAPHKTLNNKANEFLKILKSIIITTRKNTVTKANNS